jgi:hypothetical protein
MVRCFEVFGHDSRLNHACRRRRDSREVIAVRREGCLLGEPHAADGGFRNPDVVRVGCPAAVVVEARKQQGMAVVKRGEPIRFASGEDSARQRSIRCDETALASLEKA